MKKTPKFKSLLCKDVIMASVRDLCEAAVYAHLPQVCGMAFCLLRAEPEETITQSLVCHGKSGKIFMPELCGLWWPLSSVKMKYIWKSRTSQHKELLFVPRRKRNSALDMHKLPKKKKRLQIRKLHFTLIPTSLAGSIFYFEYMKQHCLYSLRVHQLVYTACAEEQQQLR